MLVRVDGRHRPRPHRPPSTATPTCQNNVHGGALLALIDVALFAAARGFGLITAGTSVTLDLNTQFIGGGRIGEPLEAQVEVLRETGRLVVPARPRRARGRRNQDRRLLGHDPQAVRQASKG